MPKRRSMRDYFQISRKSYLNFHVGGVYDNPRVVSKLAPGLVIRVLTRKNNKIWSAAG